MWPIVTDRVVWSVGRSVCHTSDPAKMAEPMEMPFGLMTRVGSGNHVLESVVIKDLKFEDKDQSFRVFSYLGVPRV